MDELLKVLGGRHFTVVELDEAPCPTTQGYVREMARKAGLVVTFAEGGREVHIAGPN